MSRARGRQPYRRPLARDGQIEALFNTQANASTEATRQLDLLGADRDRYDVVAKRIQFRVRVGNTIRLVHSRFNLSGGKNFIVLGKSEDVQDETTTLRLWG